MDRYVKQFLMLKLRDLTDRFGLITILINNPLTISNKKTGRGPSERLADSVADTVADTVADPVVRALCQM